MWVEEIGACLLSKRLYGEFRGQARCLLKKVPFLERREMAKVYFLGGPPGTGKSTVAPLVVERLQQHHDQTVVWLDWEMFYPPAARVNDSEVSGITLDTREFMLKFNLPRQLRFQHFVREVAKPPEGIEGCVVLCTAPFENMFGEVAGRPLWTKMVEEDFAGFDISMTYMLMEGPTEEVQRQIVTRLTGRGNSEAQTILDEPKKEDPEYYEKRSELVRKSVETFGFPLISVGLNDNPTEVADRIAQAMLS